MNKNLTTVFSSKIQIASTVLMMLCIIATQGCSSASRATSTQSLPAEEVDEKVAPLKPDEVIDTQQLAQANDGSTDADRKRVLVNDFIYTLNSCIKSDANVKCDLTIENNNQTERGLKFTATASTLIDAAGESYNASNVAIRGASSSYGSYDEITPGADVPASINFDNIPEQVVKAQTLNLNLDGKSVQFRNVHFSN
jgi:flagellar basal body L-ring protein FlgH